MTLFKTRRSQFPGSRFTPTDRELIRILGRKRCSYITDLHVYEKEPWLLQHVRHFRSVKNQWFYFVRRTKPPGIKKEDSKKTSRTVAGFTWKGNTTTSILDENEVTTIGYNKSLTFLVNNKSSGWVMHEFTLNKNGFQEVVLCKILFNPGKDNAQYAPRLEPIVIGQPQPPLEEAVEDKKDLYVAANEEIPYLNVPVKIHQGVEQQEQQLWTRSCPSEVVTYPTGQYQQLMNGGGREQYQDFGSFGQFVGGHRYYQNMLQGMRQNQDFGSYAQYWEGALAQNHLPSVTIETHQGVEQQQKLWTGSCPSEVVSYSTGQYQQLLNGGMEQYQDFGSFGKFVGTQPDFGSYAQCFGGDLAQNHQGIEPQQHDNVWGLHCLYSNNIEIEPQQNDNSLAHQYVEHQDFGDLTQYHLSVVPMETQKYIEPQQQDNSCFGQNVVENQTMEQQQQHVRQDSKFSVTQQNMMEHQNFGSFTQFLGGDLTQNHLSVVPMETQKGIKPQQHDNSLAHQGVEHQEFGSFTQFSGGELTQNHISMVSMETKKYKEPQQQDNNDFGHNVVENETTEPPNLTQEQNQPLGELDETDEFVNWEWPLELEDMANFGNKEWRKQLGENTPEEEAELKADLGNCKTTASLINYFCPI